LTKYHDIRTLRERVAGLLYRLPIFLRPIERWLAVSLIPFVEGKNPHSQHRGRNCPCWSEKQ